MKQAGRVVSLLDLLATPGNFGSATHVWTFQADGSSVVNAGGTTFDTAAEGLSGSLSGATGSFTITIEATYQFNPTSFTNTLSDLAGSKWAYDGASDTYGILSPDPLNNAIQISGTEAMVMTFDLSGLTLAPDITGAGGQKRFMGFQFSVVPEPSSLALILMGSGGLALLRRRLR